MLTVIWGDDALTRLEYENVETAYFETVPEWKRVQLELPCGGGSVLHLPRGVGSLGTRGH